MIWTFYDNQFKSVHVEGREHCQEPPVGLILSNERNYYEASFSKHRKVLILKLVNRFKAEEKYKVLSVNEVQQSVNEVQQSDERLAYCKITLVRLHGINNS